MLMQPYRLSQFSVLLWKGLFCPPGSSQVLSYVFFEKMAISVVLKQILVQVLKVEINEHGSPSDWHHIFWADKFTLCLLLLAF